MSFFSQKIIKNAVAPQDTQVGYVEVGVFDRGLLAVDVVVLDHDMRICGAKIIIFPDFSLQNPTKWSVIS